MLTDDLNKVLSGEKLSINDDDVVPGTVHLIDMEGALHVQKADGGEHNIILQPQPSDNVNDPLRWSQKKKNLQFLLLFVWSFFLAITVNWSGPYWTQFTLDLDCTYTQLNISSALCFLFLGMGCLFLQPTAMKLGRRFVYLICTVLALIANIIGIKATNIGYFYATNIIAGFSAAPVDSLVEISSTDVFFAHERASKLSWLILALYFGSDIGPVVAGYLPNWRWAFKIQVIIFCILLVCQVFLMQDTTFDREDQHTEETILEQIKSREVALEAVHTGVADENDDKLQAIISGEHLPVDGESELQSTKRTYWKTLQFLELEYNDKRSWLTIFYRPFFMACFPAIIWGGVVYGSQMMWLSLLATTQSEIYATYYGFSTSSTGLTNLAPLCGSFIGMLYGGPFVDWMSIKMAKRNHGILEPEFRLWAMIAPTCLNAAGLLAYGLASVSVRPWPVSVVVGQGLIGFAMSSSGPICLTYAIECYPRLASEGLVLMLFVRNMIGCGFTFAIQPWLDRDGLTTTTWLMFMISLVVNGSFIILVIWGKKFRRMTKQYYYKISDKRFGELF